MTMDSGNRAFTIMEEAAILYECVILNKMTQQTSAASLLTCMAVMMKKDQISFEELKEFIKKSIDNLEKVWDGFPDSFPE